MPSASGSVVPRRPGCAAENRGTSPRSEQRCSWEREVPGGGCAQTPPMRSCCSRQRQVWSRLDPFSSGSYAASSRVRFPLGTPVSPAVSWRCERPKPTSDKSPSAPVADAARSPRLRPALERAFERSRSVCSARSDTLHRTASVAIVLEAAPQPPTQVSRTPLVHSLASTVDRSRARGRGAMRWRRRLHQARARRAAASTGTPVRSKRTAAGSGTGTSVISRLS